MFEWIKRLFGRNRPHAHTGLDVLEQPLHRSLPEASNSTPLEDEKDIRLDFFLHAVKVLALADSGQDGEVRSALAGLLKQESISTYVPRLPSIVPRLMIALRDPDRTTPDFVEILHKDPVAVAEVLRVANSAYYRARERITSLEQAILRLGVRGLRETLARIVFRPVIEVKSDSPLAPQWLHVDKLATAASAYAGHMGGDRFEAYLGGLGMMTGQLVASRALDGIMLRREVSPELYADLQHVLPRLSHQVVRDWGFPDNVVQALDPSHQYAGEVSKLRETLEAGERIAMLHTLCSDGCYTPEECQSDWLQVSSSTALQQNICKMLRDLYDPA